MLGDARGVARCRTLRFTTRHFAARLGTIQSRTSLPHVLRVTHLFTTADMPRGAEGVRADLTCRRFWSHFHAVETICSSERFPIQLSSFSARRPRNQRGFSLRSLFETT